MLHKTNGLIQRDTLLKPYRAIIERRISHLNDIRRQLVLEFSSLSYAASGHLFYGLHRVDQEWIFREWAPNATAIWLVSDRTGWLEIHGWDLKKIDDAGNWELRLPADLLRHGNLYRLRIHWKEASGDRIPAYANRVVQDPVTLIFNAQVWQPDLPYTWKNGPITEKKDAIFIYEAHIGMAQEEEKIGSYKEFTQNILPHVVDSGYDSIQLMALQEHPYYGSFGYQVSSFFAPSSRFGTPDDLRELIDTAHGYGLRVLMDIIHSHAVANEVEGLSRFDGTLYQYFHDGTQGKHPAWDSRCFDYGKRPVLRFLLSNCRYWLQEYQLDGFRFDGITSMMYRHHGLNMAFTGYSQYFDEWVDDDALIYLTLANQLIHEINPAGVTIAEDMSGMPGLALPIEDGGLGFDYRFAMGVPDYWIRLVKDTPDELWPMGHLWFELTNRRPDEKFIGYAESHDQALVGDQTLIFRLIGSDMYDAMHVQSKNFNVDRGIALHKMIRLVTLATAGNGYLTFMGNEFGHPEWIDFPREGNQWSLYHARRQWQLMNDSGLRYHGLAAFDRDMIELAKSRQILETSEMRLLVADDIRKILAFERNRLIFVFNFHPTQSFIDHLIPVIPGKFRMILDTDSIRYGGHGRLISDQIHFSQMDIRQSHHVSLYIPTRTAMVLQPEENI
jgi:1,4-alpha-glucan branching enzyme